MDWLRELLALRWLSRVRLGMLYRQVAWIVAAVAIPLGVLAVIVFQSQDIGQAFRTQLLLVVAFGFFVAAVMGWMNATYLSYPVGAMTKLAEAIAVGDIEQKVVLDEERGDELGEMARAFRAMVSYVEEMAVAAERISSGDLTVRVVPRSHRDVLGSAFQGMVQDLRGVIGQVAQGANDVAEASRGVSGAADQIGSGNEQVTRAMRQVSQGNQEQAVGVSRSSQYIEQLAAAIQQVALDAKAQAAGIDRACLAFKLISDSAKEIEDRSAELRRAGQRAEEAARNGAQTVARTVDGMHSITAAVEASAERMQELGKRSEQIGQIVEAIDEIAEQTNLLALNAAIEAARAGEHGRGFAVVADEVRKLAERSSKATKEIAQLISTVQKDTAEAVESMNRGAREVEQGRGVADEAGKALQEISAAVSLSNAQVQRIAAAAQQMTAHSEDVARAMESVNEVVERNTAASQEVASRSSEATTAIEMIAAVAQENSAAAEEVTASTEEMSSQLQSLVASAQELNAMAEGLREAVGRFRLGEASPSRSAAARLSQSYGAPSREDRARAATA